MEFTTTAIPGLVAFRPTPHRDARGFFSRTFDVAVAREAGVDPDAFVQDSMSRSAYGVIRGLHLRVGRGEGKLVRCSHGRVFDVVVDLRPTSPAYRTWVSFDLDGEEQNSIFIPPGCAHGFQTLADDSELLYQHSAAYSPALEDGVRHDDPRLAIDWPEPATSLSPRDLALGPFDGGFEGVRA